MTPAHCQRARPWLGTYVHIEAVAPAPAQALAAVEAAFAAVAQVHATLGFQAADSELTRLNRLAHLAPQAVGPDTWAVLQLAHALHTASGGAFDPAVAPCLARRSDLCPPPALPEPSGTWRDVALLPGHRIRYRRPLWLDFGGLAKGYAVDRAIAALLQAGAHAGRVNAGGDLAAFGPDLRTPLQVRHPGNPASTLPLGQIRDGAAATSAGYFGCDALAIVDPETGTPLPAGVSITVLAPTCALADGLTKVVALRAEAATACLRHFNASATIIDSAGNLSACGEFLSRLQRQP